MFDLHATIHPDGSLNGYHVDLTANIPFEMEGGKLVHIKWCLDHREELNTIGSYMCLLAQKSANINWLGKRSYWHEFIGSSDVHGCLVSLKEHQKDSGFESTQV
jgi:hypothetical protein